MTDLVPGTYIIYSKALDNNGNKLAITFEGANQFAQVTPLNSAPIQVVCAMLFFIFHSAIRTHLFFTVECNNRPEHQRSNRCPVHQIGPSTWRWRRSHRRFGKRFYLAHADGHRWILRVSSHSHKPLSSSLVHTYSFFQY